MQELDQSSEITASSLSVIVRESILSDGLARNTAANCRDLQAVEQTGANYGSLVLENLPDQHPEPLSFSDHKFDRELHHWETTLGRRWFECGPHDPPAWDREWHALMFRIIGERPVFPRVPQQQI